MTATLPAELQRVFTRFVTTEFTTLDGRGQPITWPLTPYYSEGAATIDVSTGLGYPKKAKDARANPHVALLFSDPTGSELERPPMVLVQGTASVDDDDLDANRARYERESGEKFPATRSRQPPGFMRRFFTWYYARIYVKVRPERVYIWADGDVSREPELFDSHMEEVRSGHDEEPAAAHAAPDATAPLWDERIDSLGARHETAVLSLVAPDGFPFSVRLPVAADRGAGVVQIEGDPVGVPLQPGLACLSAHEHAPDMTWQRNFQLRGDLVEHGDGWAVVPHRVVGGFEVPQGTLALYRENLRKMLRFRRVARRELERRGGAGSR